MCFQWEVGVETVGECIHIMQNKITLIPILIQYTVDATDYPVKEDESTIAVASKWRWDIVEPFFPNYIYSLFIIFDTPTLFSSEITTKNTVDRSSAFCLHMR